MENELRGRLTNSATKFIGQAKYKNKECEKSKIVHILHLTWIVFIFAKKRLVLCWNNYMIFHILQNWMCLEWSAKKISALLGTIFIIICFFIIDSRSFIIRNNRGYLIFKMTTDFGVLNRFSPIHAFEMWFHDVIQGIRIDFQFEWLKRLLCHENKTSITKNTIAKQLHFVSKY